MAIAKVSYKKLRDGGQQNFSSLGNINFSASDPLIKMMPINEIMLDPKGEFQKLFPIESSDLDNIAESMRKKGFYKNQHVLYAHIEDEDVSFLIDGHTRLQAARLAGLDKVAVYELNFETRDDATNFALELQLNRRNLTSAQLLQAIDKFKGNKKVGRKSLAVGEAEPRGKSSEELARRLGVSTRKVEMGNAILQSGDKDLIASVENEDVSITAAYNQLRKKNNGGSGAERTEPHESGNSPERDAEGSSGEGEHTALDDFGDVSVNCEEDTDEEVSVMASVAYDVFCYALSEAEKGRSPRDIFRDGCVSDFSPSVIRGFRLPSANKDIIRSFRQS